MPLLAESDDFVTTAAFADKKNKKRSIIKTPHETSERSTFFSMWSAKKPTTEKAKDSTTAPQGAAKPAETPLGGAWTI